jgi:uncharacterized SAM-binding protein YcdF (DUF218 family)
MPSSTAPRERFGRLLVRKERWGLSWRAYALLATAFALCAVVWLFNVYAFLAVTQRVEARFLSVEGWVNSHAIRAAADEFRAGGYERVFTTGGPIEGASHYIDDYGTGASIGASRLKQIGVAPELIEMVPVRERARDRTYSSAVVLRRWFEEQRIPVKSINVLTADVHARRTRLLFQRAFGDEVKVGIVSVPNPTYDAEHWWRYSQGVRAVLGECIAYLYVKLFFHPAPLERTGP